MPHLYRRMVRDSKPQALPETERAEECKRGEFGKILSLVRSLTCSCWQWGIYASRRVYGPRRLADRARYEADQRLVLADPDHASRRQRPR